MTREIRDIQREMCGKSDDKVALREFDESLTHLPNSASSSKSGLARRFSANAIATAGVLRPWQSMSIIAGVSSNALDPLPVK